MVLCRWFKFVLWSVEIGIILVKFINFVRFWINGNVWFLFLSVLILLIIRIIGILVFLSFFKMSLLFWVYLFVFRINNIKLILCNVDDVVWFIILLMVCIFFLCIFGVLINIVWDFVCELIFIILWCVVCGLCEVIDNFWFNKWFINVDLFTFGWFIIVIKLLWKFVGIFVFCLLKNWLIKLLLLFCDLWLVLMWLEEFDMVDYCFKSFKIFVVVVCLVKWWLVFLLFIIDNLFILYFILKCWLGVLFWILIIL